MIYQDIKPNICYSDVQSFLSVNIYWKRSIRNSDLSHNSYNQYKIELGKHESLGI